LDKKIPTALASGVFLVRGAKNGAIYDTNTGNVYSINESAVRVVLGENVDPEYTAQLINLNLLGNTEYPKPAEIRKAEIKLDFVWFEIIGDDCNESCDHCYADSMPQSRRKKINPTEKPEAKPQKKLTESQWRSLVQETYDLGARSCQFIGGEPFIYVGDELGNVLDLAEFAAKVGFENIEIFSNGTMISKSDIQRIKDLQINMAISLYSSDPQIHDSITRTKGSHALTVRTLQRLQEAGIPTRVEMVLMKKNQHCVERTRTFISEIGIEVHDPDVLRPKGRGDNPEIQPDDEPSVRYGLMLGPNFSAQKEIFTHYSTKHSCLAGKITITDTGNVLPCIFSRDQVTGNILESSSLKSVIDGEALTDVWQTTKDDVLVCQDCEYRHVCFDCRPLSQGANGENGDYKTAPYPRCTYNPYEGIWGGGTWKLNASGTPYYDESLKPIIEKIRNEGQLGNQAVAH